MEKLPNSGRRLFLKGTTAGLAAGALWQLGALRDPERPPLPVQPEKTAPAPPEKEIAARREIQEVAASPEQKILQQTDDDVVAETLSEQLEHSDRVTIDQKTIEAIYQKWHKAYSPDGARHNDLVSGLRRMEPWLEDMKAAFRENRLPEEFVYLAIAESHFQMFARSRSDARGPYQFMEKTAKKPPADLTVTAAYDERIDPIGSAAACAKLLTDNYRHFGGDIRTPVRYNKTDDALYLAISGYNGTYPWQYGKATPRKSRSIDHYLAFVEKRINGVISEAAGKNTARKHTVRAQDTLAAIARRYAVTPESIRETNALRGSALKAGQKLRIPVPRERRTDAIRHALRNHNENLNYPAKFYAILDVIRNLELEKRFAGGKKLEFSEIPVQNSQRIALVHTVRKGDTLYSIGRQYGKHLGVTETALRQTILTENKLSSAGALTIGQRITIGASRQTPTLAKLAQAHDVRLDILRAYNPAVLSTDHPLPDIPVRIPKNTLLAKRS